MLEKNGNEKNVIKNPTEQQGFKVLAEKQGFAQQRSEKNLFFENGACNRHSGVIVVKTVVIMSFRGA